MKIIALFLGCFLTLSACDAACISQITSRITSDLASGITADVMEKIAPVPSDIVSEITADILTEIEKKEETISESASEEIHKHKKIIITSAADSNFVKIIDEKNSNEQPIIEEFSNLFNWENKTELPESLDEEYILSFYQEETLLYGESIDTPRDYQHIMTIYTFHDSPYVKTVIEIPNFVPEALLTKYYIMPAEIDEEFRLLITN